MNVSYLDPIDAETIWYSPHTLVLGMSCETDRKSMTEFFQKHHADVFDLFREPDLLIPKMLDYSCFLRILDYAIYKQVEPALSEYLKGDEDTSLTATVVYGAAREDLFDSISIINGSRLHPTVLAGYYAFLIRNR